MPRLPVTGLFRIFIEKNPGEQLFVGLSLLVMGVVIVPFVGPKMLAVITWMNGPLAEQAWHRTGMRFMRGFFVFASAYFALLGIGRLVIYACVKGGLIGSPWT